MLSPTKTSSNYSKKEEVDLFYLFQIDLDNYFEVKFGLEWHMKFQPSEIENLDFYEYEIHVERLNDILKKQQDQRDKEEKNQPNINPERYMKDVQRQYSKPNMSPKMPKFNI